MNLRVIFVKCVLHFSRLCIGLGLLRLLCSLETMSNNNDTYFDECLTYLTYVYEVAKNLILRAVSGLYGFGRGVEL